ncbi:MAG: tetratricopeptide repeat protein [Pirellulaceae bacterium]|nr:tetratricopeptide repeat protein [Pirellulaceae bacterium]
MPKRKKKHNQPVARSAPVGNKTTSPALLSVLLAAVTLVSYLPVYRAGYIEFDDQMYVRDNVHVASGLTADNIAWAITSTDYASNWHPLTWINHMLDAELFGTAPAGHHVMNVLFHVACVVLLFLLLRRMTGQTIASLIVAGLFAVHPMNVESVAWIAQRKATLSTLLGILTIWFYSDYAQHRSLRAYVVSLVMFALSLSAKPMLVTLPFGLLLLDYWPLQRQAMEPATDSASARLQALIWGVVRLLPEKIPFFVLTMGGVWMTLVAQSDAMNPFDKYPLSARLGNVTIAYVEYLWMMIWPVKLAVLYPLYADTITVIRVAGATLFVATVSVACLWLGLRQRYLLVGWLWYLGMLVPVIGLIQVGAQALADRYVYVPIWGIWIGLVWAGHHGLQRLTISQSWKWALALVATVMFGCLSWLTFRQAARWHDTETLFGSAVENTERNWLAHRVLANHYLQLEDYRQTIYHCQQPETWGREDPHFLSAYGRALHAIGSATEAIVRLERAVELDPSMALARANLGWVYLDFGRYQDAADQLSAAAQLLTDKDTVYSKRITYANWGIALSELGQPAEALGKFEYALSLEPNQPDLLRAAAQLDIRLGALQRAEQRVHSILQGNPGDLAAFQLLTEIYRVQGNLPAVIQNLRQLVESIPNHYDARLQLANALQQAGQVDEARARWQALIDELSKFDQAKVASFLSRVYCQLAESWTRADPATAVQLLTKSLDYWANNAMAINNLAWLLATCSQAELRDPQRALTLAQQALELSGDNEWSAHSTLAAALAANQQFDQAVTSAERARQLLQIHPIPDAVQSLNEQLEKYKNGQSHLE